MREKREKETTGEKAARRRGYWKEWRGEKILLEKEGLAKKEVERGCKEKDCARNGEKEGGQNYIKWS